LNLVSSTMPPDYIIRPMEEKDLDLVVAAEARCYSHPWSAKVFLRELANPLAQIRLLFVATELAGYLCSWFICGELHIHNVATLPEFRRRGVAARLIQTAMAAHQGQGLERVFLEVRAGNAGAIALYRSLGFRQSGCRKRYYPDGEDALLMELERVPTANDES